VGIADATLVELGAAELGRRRDDLCALLADAVEGNASVGFVLPIDSTSLDAYWRGIEPEVRDGSRVVFAALDDDAVVGSVQLALCTKPNQPHRADVQKLLVHRRARGHGIGASLMRALERHAVAAGRWLLTLDTRSGSAADALYAKWGWQVVGRVPDYALDPDGTLAACTFYWKRLA
jgi:GNAT superfamily N-acetyltransferase